MNRGRGIIIMAKRLIEGEGINRYSKEYENAVKRAKTKLCKRYFKEFKEFVKKELEGIHNHG